MLIFELFVLSTTALAAKPVLDLTTILTALSDAKAIYVDAFVSGTPPDEVLVEIKETLKAIEDIKQFKNHISRAEFKDLSVRMPRPYKGANDGKVIFITIVSPEGDWEQFELHGDSTLISNDGKMYYFQKPFYKDLLIFIRARSGKVSK